MALSQLDLIENHLVDFKKLLDTMGSIDRISKEFKESLKNDDF